MTAAELAATRAEAERLRRRCASLQEENDSLQEAVQLVAAAQKEVTVRPSRSLLACLLACAFWVKS